MMEGALWLFLCLLFVWAGNLNRLYYVFALPRILEGDFCCVSLLKVPVFPTGIWGDLFLPVWRLGGVAKRYSLVLYRYIYNVGLGKPFENSDGIRVVCRPIYIRFTTCLTDDNLVWSWLWNLITKKQRRLTQQADKQVITVEQGIHHSARNRQDRPCLVSPSVYISHISYLISSHHHKAIGSMCAFTHNLVRHQK